MDSAGSRQRKEHKGSDEWLEWGCLRWVGVVGLGLWGLDLEGGVLERGSGAVSGWGGRGACPCGREGK